MKDGIIAEVTGKVSRQFETKTGQAFAVELERRNSEFPVKVSIFGLESMPEVGTRLTIRGIFSWNTREVNGKKYTNYNLNATNILASEPGGEADWRNGEEPF